MKQFAISILFLLTNSSLLYAQSRTKAEYYMDIPIYIDSIQASLHYPLAWRNCKSSMSLAQWQQKARSKVLECMGNRPPMASAWDMKVVAEEKRNGYKAMKVEFALSRWYRAYAYILVPNGKGPFPAVNLLHDHGAHLYIGKEKMIAPIAEEQSVVDDANQWDAQIYGGQFLGDYLAQSGYVVMSVDAPLWGERGRKEGVDRKKYDIIAGNMMMLGQNLCAYMHYDDIAATEFLASLSFVDSDRIAAAGCSMGAYRAWMLSALSDRVKACCSVCWMTTTDTQLSTRYGRSENGGFANCIPGLRLFLDYPDIASIAAPKPTLFIAGDRDKLFQTDGVRKAYDIMHSVWNDAGGEQNIQTDILSQPHECNVDNQKAILQFLDKQLK